MIYIYIRYIYIYHIPHQDTLKYPITCHYPNMKFPQSPVPPLPSMCGRCYTKVMTLGSHKKGGAQLGPCLVGVVHLVLRRT